MAPARTLDTDAASRAVIVAHAFLSPVVFSTVTADSFETPKSALLVAAALVLAGLRLAAGPPRAPDARPRQPPALTAGILLLVFSAAGSTLASVSPRTSILGAHESFAGLVTIAALVVVFFETLRTARSSADARRIAVAACAGGAVAAAYAIVQWLGLDPIAWGRIAALGDRVRPFGTLGHPNLLGAYLAMCLPLAVGSAAWTPRRWARILAATAALLALVACALTLSRGAWLAMAAVGAIGTAPLARRALRHARLGALLGATLLLAGVGVAAVARWPAARPYIDRGLQVQPGPRLEIWRAAWGIFRERPVLGSGPDTFALAFPRHRSLAYQRLEFNHVPLRAHNDLLHLLATQGALGLAAAVLAAAGAVQAARRALRGAHEHRSVAGAFALSLVGWVAAGATGFTVAATGSLAAIAAAVLASLARGSAPPRGARRVRPLWNLGTALLTAPALVLLVVQPLRASARSREAARLLRTDPARAALLAEKAVRLDPQRDVYHARLAQARLAASRSARPAERVGLLVAARDAAERAVALVPADAYHHAALGTVEAELALSRGEYPHAAWPAFEAAFALDPRNAALRAAAASAAERAGDVRQGRAQAAEAHRLLPEFGAPLAQLGRRAAAEGRREDAAALLRRSLGLPWYSMEDQRVVAESNLASVLLSLGRFAEAEAVARSVVGRRPGSAEAAASLGRALEGQGRLEEAADLYRAALALRPDHAVARAGLARLQ